MSAIDCTFKMAHGNNTKDESSYTANANQNQNANDHTNSHNNNV